MDYKHLSIKNSINYYNHAEGRRVTTYAKFKKDEHEFYLAKLTIYKSEKGGEVEIVGEWYEISEQDYLRKQ